jgi:hypothetical protein
MKNETELKAIQLAFNNGIRLVCKHYTIPTVGLSLTLFIQLTDAFPLFVWLGVLVGIFQAIFTFALPKLFDLAETTGLTADDLLFIPLKILRRTWLQGVILFGTTTAVIITFVAVAKSSGIFLSDGAIICLIILMSGCAACLSYMPVFVSLFDKSLISGIRISIRYAIHHKVLTGVLFLFTILTMIPATFGVTSRVWLILQQIIVQIIAYILTAISYSYIVQNKENKQLPTNPRSN